MRAIGVALAVLVALAGGCVIFTGSSDGYSVNEAGTPTCASAADCRGGAVCCLVVTSSTTSTAGTCMSSCSTSYPQLCAKSSECGDAGSCSMLSCSVDAGGVGVSVSIQACGTVPGCH
jgi:hypothetical protein